MVEYGGLADELHLIVFSRRTMSRESGIRDEKSRIMFLFITQTLFQGGSMYLTPLVSVKN